VTQRRKKGNIQVSVEEVSAALWPAVFAADVSSLAISLISTLSRTSRVAAASSSFLFALQYRSSRGDIYNILWGVVFGFATLNILSLAAKRLEPTRRGLSFGELIAVMVVVMSVVLLGWEMLNLFHIFPIHLRRSS
jgi:hypothetical protein